MSGKPDKALPASKPVPPPRRNKTDEVSKGTKAEKPTTPPKPSANSPSVPAAPLSKPPPPPPPPPPLSVAPTVGYHHVESDSPHSSNGNTQVEPSTASGSNKRNPFSASFKEPPVPAYVEQYNGTDGNSNSKNSNPFRESYDESANSSNSKKSNPFRDSYKEDDETTAFTGTNPFEAEKHKAASPAKSAKPNQNKQATSRANPIINVQMAPKNIATDEHSAHGSDVEASSEREVVYNNNRGLKKAGQPGNPIYHLNRFSDLWMCAFLLIHIGQFVLLLNVGYKALPDGGFGVVTILAFFVPALVLVARFLSKKSRLSERRNLALKDWVCTPEDEADSVPDAAVYCIASAAVVEGFTFALFTAISSGNYQYLDDSGFYTKGTILQVLRFASITLLALHRTLRPANRLDPMRTVLELEVIAVCWDALDGSTLYQLLDGDHSLAPRTMDAIRTLMAAWYLSVGVRMALMFLTNLSPTSRLQRWTITAPFQLADQATVDRTLQGLRLKSIITMTMCLADLFAAFLRSILWINGKLDALQQDMCIKNYMFLSAVMSAYYNFENTSKKEWNARELLDWPIELKIPKRPIQLEMCRYMFMVSYALIAALGTAILITVSEDPRPWVGNLILDGVLLLIFFVYAKNAHRHDPNHLPTAFFKPHSGFFHFPGKMATLLSVLLAASLMGARLPGLYFHYASLSDATITDGYTYENAMLLVVFTIVPLGCFSNFWSISYMLFRKEFTAAPGSYHAIHDPSINMVSAAVTVEGALDVLSAATLMQLAENSLPEYVNNAIVLFCLLELVNAGQCFALPCLLSGGHDDTPKDLVRYNAYLRCARGCIDLGTIILRVVLWIQYDAVSSVFLVKNLYNLIHTATQVDRYLGVRYYPDGTLFSEYVPSYDWYGMTRVQWREAIYSERSIPASDATTGVHFKGVAGVAASLGGGR